MSPLWTIEELKHLYDTMRWSPLALKDALYKCNPDLPNNDWTLGYFRDRIRRLLSRKIPHRVGAPNRYDNCFRRSEKSPHDYQKTVVNFMMQNRGLIVYHKVGAGKTLTAILVSQCFLMRFPWKRVIVVTPAGLLANFEKEMRESYGRIFAWDHYDFYSYETFMNKQKKIEAEIHKLETSKLPNRLERIAALRSQGNCAGNLLIIDEGHNLRNLYTRTVTDSGHVKESGIKNKYLTQCAEEAEKVLILTGTPLYNSKNDIIALYNMVRDPTRSERITRPGAFRFDWLRCLVSYYEPAVHSKDFPRRVNHAVRLKMSDHYVAEYEKIVKIIEHEETSKQTLFQKIFGALDDPKSFHNVIRRAVNNLEDKEYRRGRLTELPKITWVLDKIENVTSFPGPIVVFSHFLEAGNRILVAELRKRARKRIIFEHLRHCTTLREFKKKIQAMYPNDANLRHCLYTIWRRIEREKVDRKSLDNPFSEIHFGVIEGMVDAKERAKIIQRYNRGELRVLFISKAGGEGLDLKNTRAVILLEPSWNDAGQEQVIGRAIRFQSHVELPKKDRQVDVYYIMLYKPADKKPFKQILAWLQNQDIDFEDKSQRPPVLDPYHLSIDVFLMAYLNKKQQTIDRYDQIVKSHAIENHRECFFT